MTGTPPLPAPPAPVAGAPCPICGAACAIVRQDHPGYAEPARFSIAECAYCDAQFALPLVPDPALYQRIYEHAGTLPGYSRYAWYADRITRVADPLAWLAARQEMYAFVATWVERLDPDRSRDVVEVGSGLGYLTFALHRAGHRARGLEMSEEAVRRARERFGDLYRAADATAMQHAESADVVVMTEVLEHVSDPVGLLRGLARLLRPGGTALVTTPSKSSHPSGAIWQTDNPPVHLWWFSETSLRRLAERAGLRVHLPPLGRPAPASERDLPAYFDAAGRQVAPSPLTRRALRMAPGLVQGLASALRVRRERSAARAMAAERSPSIGAVLTKPA